MFENMKRAFPVCCLFLRFNFVAFMDCGIVVASGLPVNPGFMAFVKYSGHLDMNSQIP